mmetsp:Transcript_103898/g.318245  ORF Transcript_103898/g.318245 Transcript_103898/m.318245 type:complete len:247 (+) Transcript_103898:264-1004(+)
MPPLKLALFMRTPSLTPICTIVPASSRAAASRSMGPAHHVVFRRLKRHQPSSTPRSRDFQPKAASMSPQSCGCLHSAVLASTPLNFRAMSGSKVPKSQPPPGNGLLHAMTAVLQPRYKSLPSRAAISMLYRGHARFIFSSSGLSTRSSLVHSQSTSRASAARLGRSVVWKLHERRSTYTQTESASRFASMYHSTAFMMSLHRSCQANSTKCCGICGPSETISMSERRPGFPRWLTYSKIMAGCSCS